VNLLEGGTVPAGCPDAYLRQVRPGKAVVLDAAPEIFKRYGVWFKAGKCPERRALAKNGCRHEYCKNQGKI